MDDQTKKLLKECNVGCKMALQSMTQVEDYLEDSELERAVEDYRREHERVEKETSRSFNGGGCIREGSKSCGICIFMDYNRDAAYDEGRLSSGSKADDEWMQHGDSKHCKVSE